MTPEFDTIEKCEAAQELLLRKITEVKSGAAQLGIAMIYVNLEIKKRKLK
jgi:hypothetical protein